MVWAELKKSSTTTNKRQTNNKHLKLVPSQPLDWTWTWTGTGAETGTGTGTGTGTRTGTGTGIGLGLGLGQGWDWDWDWDSAGTWSLLEKVYDEQTTNKRQTTNKHMKLGPSQHLDWTWTGTGAELHNVKVSLIDYPLLKIKAILVTNIARLRNFPEVTRVNKGHQVSTISMR